MLQSNTRAAVAATYPNKSIAEACLRDLKNAGFHGAWMAVTKSDPGDAENATAQPSQPAAPHMVAESSDGVAGTLGRYFSGESSLRHSLVERGLSEADAREVDASLPAEGAVVVAQGGERVDEAASILARGASRVFGAEGERFARYPSTTDTVPGQGDELDRGSDRNRSGGGLGGQPVFGMRVMRAKTCARTRSANSVTIRRRKSPSIRSITNAARGATACSPG